MTEGIPHLPKFTSEVERTAQFRLQASERLTPMQAEHLVATDQLLNHPVTAFLREASTLLAEKHNGSAHLSITNPFKTDEPVSMTLAWDIATGLRDPDPSAPAGTIVERFFTWKEVEVTLQHDSATGEPATIVFSADGERPVKINYAATDIAETVDKVLTSPVTKSGPAAQAPFISKKRKSLT